MYRANDPRHRDTRLHVVHLQGLGLGLELELELGLMNITNPRLHVAHL